MKARKKDYVTVSLDVKLLLCSMCMCVIDNIDFPVQVIAPTCACLLRSKCYCMKWDLLAVNIRLQP